MKNKTIGIIGGMGPEASAHFYKLLIYHAQKDYGVTKNDEFPCIYLASIPVPDFISNEEKEEQALNLLLNKMKDMEALDISFYCMACNTGHLLIDRLRAATLKPFVSLLEEVPKYLRRKKIKKIGLLATPTTLKTKLYEKPLNDNGIDVLIPKNSDITKMGKIILDTIAGINMEKNSHIIQDIARNLLDRGVEGILESCTEIPLIFPKQRLVRVFDTLEILSEAVLKKYYLLK